MKPFRFCNSDKLLVWIWEQMRSSDTSTAESGSEVEDITSPKASGNYTNPRLTPVHEEVSGLWLQKERKKEKIDR